MNLKKSTKIGYIYRSFKENLNLKKKNFIYRKKKQTSKTESLYFCQCIFGYPNNGKNFQFMNQTHTQRN